MSSFLPSYLLFAFKTLTLVIAILFTFAGLLILSKNKGKFKKQLQIVELNKKFSDYKSSLHDLILDKPLLKAEKKKLKIAEKSVINRPRLFFIRFEGDIHAHESLPLQEKITALLLVATPKDEVLISIESGGGVVHGYGFCASQLARIRSANIPLTVIIDKVAASGGYMMAAVADKILAAPFAIIGSIGVITQIPNFHRLLKKNNIDFEQITAGQYKRTLTLFGENTEEAREKCQEDVNQVHHLFKQFILNYRPELDLSKVATGEYWFGTDALNLGLIDGLSTTEDHLMRLSEHKAIYEISYELKRPLIEKLSQSFAKLYSQWTTT